MVWFFAVVVAISQILSGHKYHFLPGSHRFNGIAQFDRYQHHRRRQCDPLFYYCYYFAATRQTTSTASSATMTMTMTATAAATTKAVSRSAAVICTTMIWRYQSRMFKVAVVAAAAAVVPGGRARSVSAPDRAWGSALQSDGDSIDHLVARRWNCRPLLRLTSMPPPLLVPPPPPPRLLERKAEMALKLSVAGYSLMVLCESAPHGERPIRCVGFDYNGYKPPGRKKASTNLTQTRVSATPVFFFFAAFTFCVTFVPLCL